MRALILMALLCTSLGCASRAHYETVPDRCMHQIKVTDFKHCKELPDGHTADCEVRIHFECVAL